MATTDKYILEIETAAAERGLERTQKGMGGLGAAAGRLKGVLGPIAAGLAGIAAVRGISDKITEMDDLAKAARNAGAAATPEAFEGFQVARKTLGEMGLSAAEADRAFKNMTTRIAEAAETGKGPAKDAFAKLGESILDTNGNLVSTPELFEKVTQALQDGTLTMTDARKILGDVVGPKILGGFEDLANKGISASDALADVKANSDIISLDAANNAEAFGDTMGRLQDVVGTLGTELLTALLPHLNTLAEGALAALPEIIDFVSNAFKNLEPVFSLIGTILSELVLPAFELLFTVLGKIFEFIGPFIEGGINLLVSAFESLGAIVEKIIEFFKSTIEFLGDIKDKATELAGAVGETFSGMKDRVVNSAKGAYDGVTGWFGQMYDKIVGNSIVPDMARGVEGTFATMANRMVDFVQGAVGGVVTKFQNVASGVSEGFQNIASNGLEGLRSQVSSMNSYIESAIGNLSSYVSSKLSSVWSSVSSVANRVTGSFSNLFGGFSFSNPFAGFFANGGMIPKGQFGVVGEAGPELVSGPAQVTPLNGALGQTVNYNINAVDAASFRTLLARDPEFLHRVAQRGSAMTGIGARR